jgi:hypothetical protein
VLTSRDPTGGDGFSIYAGIVTGNGNSPGYTYQTESSNDASHKNVVSRPNGNDGDFSFTSNLHLMVLFYEDNEMIAY